MCTAATRTLRLQGCPGVSVGGGLPRPHTASTAPTYSAIFLTLGCEESCLEVATSCSTSLLRRGAAERRWRNALRQHVFEADVGNSWPAEIPCRPIDARSVDRYFLFLSHPSWIKRQHDHSLERRYVAGFAARIAVGFRQPLIKIARSTVIDALLRWRPMLFH